MKKPFFSKGLKEKLYFIDSITVNGSPCNAAEEFKTVISNIELRQDFEEISQLWNSEIPKGNSYVNKFLFFKNINSEVTKLIKIIDESEHLRSNIETFADLKINSFDKSNVNDLIQETEYSHLLKTVEGFKEVITKAETYLNQNDMHPISERILKKLKQIDYRSYEQTLTNLQSLAEKKAEYQDFKDLQTRLQTILPNLIENVLSEEFTKENLPQFQQAIHFRHAQNEIHKLMDIDYEQCLFNDLREFESKEKAIIAKIASKKAWLSVLKSLESNPDLKRHLNAFAQFASKAKGKGKKAQKFRRDVQEQMKYCKKSVPCWIMDINKVAESIHPEQEMYDYVIIDEASQLGPDAIFLLYISKKIIIVGDDKQISPQNVGVTAGQMTLYIPA